MVSNNNAGFHKVCVRHFSSYFETVKVGIKSKLASNIKEYVSYLTLLLLEIRSVFYSDCRFYSDSLCQGVCVFIGAYLYFCFLVG